MKKRIIKICVTSTVLAILFACATISTYAATASIQSWHLVDGGKHLDWGGSTKYQTQFNNGVKKWNAHKSGVIRKDTATRLEDVTIADYTNKGSSTVGFTNNKGDMKFNKFHMDQLTKGKRLNVCMHELGHALGLAHNQKGDVMYKSVSKTISLSANDKASYNKSYKRY